MTAINIFLVTIAVLFIGGLVLIGRRSSKKNEASKATNDGRNRPF